MRLQLKHHILPNNLRGYGFLDVKIADNGTKMVGTFYDNLDGKDKDSFTIVRYLQKQVSYPISHET